MVTKKTWSKAKLNLKVGKCEICNKNLYNKNGGWIINAEGKYFCDDIQIEDSCFDKYLISVKNKPSNFSHYENFLQRKQQYYSAAKYKR